MAESLLDQLRRQEGFRSQAYRCPTGHLTIGYGTSLEQGIDEAEADFLLRHRVVLVRKELIERLSWFCDMPQSVQDVLVNMAYQMGVAGLLKFRLTLAALAAEQWGRAALEMQDSLWFRQTPTRAKELIEIVRHAGES